MDDEMLIQLVRKYPAFYDPLHKEYMDTNFKSTIWNDIGRELGFSGEACKTRWFNIRDNFRKSILKSAIKSGQGRKQIRPYKYYKQLQFLIKYMGESIEKVENIIAECDIPASPPSDQAMLSLESDSQHTVSQYRDEYSLTLPPAPFSHYNESLADPLASSTPSSTPRSRERKHTVSFRTGSSEVMDYLIRQNEHPVDIFLASLAPTLKELHPYDLYAAKSEMYAVVQKYELKLLKEKYPAQENKLSTRQTSSSISNTEMKTDMCE